MDAYHYTADVVLLFANYKKKFFAYVTPSRDWYIPEKREKKYALYKIQLFFKCKLYEYLQTEKGEKKAPRIIWSHPGNDVTGMAARSEKVVNTCEKVRCVCDSV
jgi:hypothetical protein